MWQKAVFSPPIFLLFLLPSICFPPFLCYASHDQTPRLPNVAAQLNSRGVDFFGSIGHKLVTKELPKTQFPTISLPIDSGPGSGEVDVTQLQIPANIFQSPKFNFKLQPPRGIHFVSAGGSLPVKGQWNASYELIGIKFYTSGWVQLLAEDIRSTLVLGVSHLRDKPQLEVFDCSADVSRLEVHIGGGVIPWLVNLFRNALAAALRETIHEQFCLSVQETLLDQLNDLLLSLPTFFQIGDRLFLNYSFDNDTQVTNTFVQSFVYADLLLQNDTECPLGPASPMSLAEPSRDQEWMLSSWLHGSVFNCLLWSLHRANMLQLTFDPNFDGGKFAKFLQTNCRFYQLCLGRFFPLLAEQYPNQHVDFHFHSASPPTAQLVPSPSEQQQNASLNLTAPFFVDLHISPWANHPELLARLEMNSTAALSLALDDGRLKGNLSSLEIRFTEVSSSIGNFSDKFLHSFSLLVQPLLEAVLQSALRPGFPLPAVDGIQLAKGSRLTALVDSQQLRVDADLEYVNTTASRLRQRFWHRRGGRSRVYVKKERPYHSVI